MGLDGLWTILGKVSTFIPGRVEKIKNEKERLINERRQILNGIPNSISSDRVIAIDKRVSEINTLLGNKASD